MEGTNESETNSGKEISDLERNNSIINALKIKQTANSLFGGKEIALPNNLFNSEDTTIKMSKSNDWFHLYR